MTASFRTTNLVDGRVVVEGTDRFGTSGVVTIDGSQWAEVKGDTSYDRAVETFEAAVEEFFRPIVEASENLEKALEKPTDSLGYVVKQEAVEATAGQEQVLIHLSKDSQILRLIEQGDFERLMWVNGELEILAVLDGTQVESTVGTLVNEGVVASGADVIGEENMPATETE